VFVPSWYPRQLLFSDDAIFERTRNEIDLSWSYWLPRAWSLLQRTRLMMRYRYVIHYGTLDMGVPPTGFQRTIFLLFLKNWYRLVQLVGVRLIFLPSGCHDHVAKEDWMKIDEGRVCSNCGYEPHCDDRVNNINFELVRQIASVSLVGDGQKTKEFKETRIRYKSFDLDLYSPTSGIPKEFIYNGDESVKVLHSHALIGRNAGGKNIKGTEYVNAAVERLQREGFDVKFVNLQGIPSRNMRFHQLQADIIVDQLIYGWYGSTSLEGLTLGKPVICYIRPSWREYVASFFPEWKNCPIISATPETIYVELRKLVSDAEYRIRVGEESRRFAENFLDVRKNVVEFEAMLRAVGGRRLLDFFLLCPGIVLFLGYRLIRRSPFTYFRFRIPHVSLQ